MKLPYFVPGVPPGEEHVDLAPMQRLVADLTAYSVGVVPTAEEIAAAPLISGWFATQDRSSCRLVGTVSGHPRVGPGPAATSRICAVDRSHRWARTYSRLWRLGPPAMPGGGSRTN